MILVSRLCIAAAIAVLAAAPAAAGQMFKIGNIVIDTPWLRATPPAAQVAGGYLKVTNHGAQADTLVGGSLTGAGRFELHQMTMDNGIMRMRPVEGGIVIPPGKTVELKPGGFHVMAMDLKGGYTAGETVKGTLVFEKAGTVEIEYAVAPVGATSPPMQMH